LSIIPQGKDIVIVGGGFAGLTLAVALLRKRHRVRIFSDIANPLNASKAAHGISTVKGILESDDRTFGLKLEGHRGFQEWLASVEAITGIKRPKDAWKTGATEKFRDLAVFRKEFGRIYRRDFIGAKRVTLNEASPESFMIASYPGDWWVEPSYVLKILEEACNALGGQIISEPITSVQYLDQCFHLQSPRTAHRCQVLVLAAGAGTSKLISCLGVNTPKLYGIAGYTFKARVPTGSTNFVPTVLVKGTSGFTASEADVHWGSTSDPSIDVMECSDSMPSGMMGVDLVAKQLWTTLLPETPPPAPEDTTARWGVRVRTRDRKPLNCRLFVPSHPEAQLWINTGFYKSGIILSWLLAETLKDKISAPEDVI
jgi:glycine/D-amino acid oxidase-like deaminating enzyme